MTEIETLQQELQQTKIQLNNQLREQEAERTARTQGWPNPELIRAYVRDTDEPVAEILAAIKRDEKNRNLWDAGYATDDVREMSHSRYCELRKSDDGKRLLGLA